MNHIFSSTFEFLTRESFFWPDWLEKTLSESKPTPKVVTVVNPGNPSGTYVPEPLLKRISKICKDAGCWLIVDNTYE